MSAARSVSCGLLVLALGGCTTTRDVNKRYELRATRVLAGRKPVRVTVPNPAVDVRRVTVVGGHAIIVDIANTSGAPLTDLPISVGVTVNGKRRYLNTHAGRADYFQTRVAALGPHARTHWVYVSHHPVKGRPFAVVGTQTAPHAKGVATLPNIAVAPAAGDRVRLTNRSGVPQYNFPVYAVAESRGHYVAAGSAIVDELDGHASVTVKVPVTGSKRAPLQPEALPTIFR